MSKTVETTREMRNSGIEWIGKIPKEWGVRRLKSISTIVTGTTPSKTNIESYENGYIPWVKPENIRTDFTISETREKLTDIGALQARLIPKGSAVVCCIGDVGKVGVLKEDATTNQQINSIIFNKNNWCSEYGKYSLVASKKEHEYKSVKTLVAIINKTQQGEIYFPLPPLHEQQAIATYLDEQVEKIDGLISAQKQAIENWKAYKQSLITETVTKGLNPDVEMKDSGIEWIGEIPNTWNVVKLKYCTYIRARLGWKGLKAEEYTEEGFPLLSAFNIINNKLVFKNLNFINQERYDESPEIKLSINDVLLVKDGAGIGKCAIVTELPFGSTVNGSIAVVTANNVLLGKYLYYYFLTNMFQKFIDRVKGGMGVPHLFQSDLKQIQIPLPNQDEQQLIADFLDEKCLKIDQTIEQKELLIKQLEEYKQSLIYECVTGKRRVL